VVVRFVDIGGIVDHHCLNSFLLKNTLWWLFVHSFLCIVSQLVFGNIYQFTNKIIHR
jgi:hypothetical protein